MLPGQEGSCPRQQQPGESSDARASGCKGRQMGIHPHRYRLQGGDQHHRHTLTKLKAWCKLCLRLFLAWGLGVWCVMRESRRFGGKEKWWICSPTKKYHLWRRNYFIIVRSQCWWSLAVNYPKFMNQNYCFTNTKFQNHLVSNYLLSDQQIWNQHGISEFSQTWPGPHPVHAVQWSRLSVVEELILSPKFVPLFAKTLSKR